MSICKEKGFAIRVGVRLVLSGFMSKRAELAHTEQAPLRRP